MKKTEAKPRALIPRLRACQRTRGIQSRIFCSFLFFTALLLTLLWLFQIVFLDQFYRYQKMESLRIYSGSIASNIDNENLLTLAERIAEENNFCVLVVDGGLNELLSIEVSPGCVIHHMSRHDLRTYIKRLDQSGSPLTDVFPMLGFRNQKYDAFHFEGRVPPKDSGNARSMLLTQKARMADGTEVYIFLNTLVTPVTATVNTIRSQLFFITAFMILLSFLLSLVLSRRVTRPLVETTEAAKALSRGEYTPVHGHVSYREIEQLNHQLTQAAKDLHRVEEMQRELIANISHDLRTPLTLIEGYAEVMRDLPGEGTPENMQVIIDETKRLTSLVNAVLDYTSLKSENPEGESRRFSLTASIRDIISRYAKLTEQDGYTIRFEPDAETYVSTDELKLGQVIYNLINNALTYTGEDKTVTVRQSVTDGKVRVEIIDTGEGIAPEQLDDIWARYYRGQKPHKRAAVGTGLGLNIVKTILDGFGFEYGVESEPQKGSTFWFALPAEKD